MRSIVLPKRSCLGAATGTAESPHRWDKYHTYPTAKNPPTTQPLTLTLTHQPPHDSPATRQHTHACTVTDSVGHSTCMSVLARRRAIMGSIVQPKRSCLGAATGTAESPHRWGKYHTYPIAKNPPTTQPLTLTLTLGTAISPTRGVFSYLPHHLDLGSEDSVGHSTCMRVLARRRAIMRSIVQPKRSCLGAATGTAESPHRWGKYHTYPTAKNPPTTQPLTLTLTHQPPHDSPATRQHTHACTVTDSVGHSTCMSVLERRRAIMGSIVQPKRYCLGAATGTAESPHRWGKYHTYPTAKNPPTTQPLTLTLTHKPRHDSHRRKPTNHRTANQTLTLGTAISPTGGVFSHLPHRLDLASEDSVGHSTCMKCWRVAGLS